MDLPISALPDATVPLGGSESVAVVQSGQTRRAPASAFGGGGGGYVSMSNAQSATASTTMSVDGPPSNSIVDVTMVVNLTAVTTPDMFAMRFNCEDFNAGTQNVDGPVNAGNTSYGHNEFTATSESGTRNLVPASGCYFVLTQRTVVPESASIAGTIEVGPAFVGKFNAYITVTQVAAIPFI